MRVIFKHRPVIHFFRRKRTRAHDLFLQISPECTATQDVVTGTSLQEACKAMLCMPHTNFLKLLDYHRKNKDFRSAAVMTHSILESACEIWPLWLSPSRATPRDIQRYQPSQSRSVHYGSGSSSMSLQLLFRRGLRLT